MTPPRHSVWPWAALVTAGGVVATAHGLYAVAVASGVPTVVAALYPAMADGLALVAYAATKRLPSTVYPWAVVVVAAGLSGLAQGVNLAGFGAPGWWLRFGVGAAPAAAVLASAHLLWLVGRPRAGTEEVRDGTVRQREGEGAVRGRQLEAGQPGAGPAAGDGEGREPAGGGEVRDRTHPGQAREAVAAGAAVGSGTHKTPQPGPAAPALAAVAANGHGDLPTLVAKADREAREYLAEHGVLPSENVLARQVGCSRGTARNALVPLRRG